MSNATSPTSPQNTGYRVKNWAKYNDALVNRGNITLWFDEELVENGRHSNEETKVGRPFIYSDSVMMFALILKVMFQLPYRQTEGLLRALVQLSNLQLPVPDYTSIAKRAETMKVSIEPGKTASAIDLVVDSTGLKVFGEGEWKVRQHGQGKRRVWRKIHLAVDPHTHYIHAHVTTESNVHDSHVVGELLNQVTPNVQSFRGDGAYDTHQVYERLTRDGIDPIIPPRSNAVASQQEYVESDGGNPTPRDCAVWAIQASGEKQWKHDTNYHQRSNAETAMFRLKRSFGERLFSKKRFRQATEVALRCKLLNAFVALGMPLSAWS